MSMSYTKVESNINQLVLCHIFDILKKPPTQE
jgi:hypothetical protein